MTTDEIKKDSKWRFLVAACIFIFKDDKILVTKRNESRDHDPGKRECVSGRFDQDFNTVESEVMREAHEELWEEFTCRLIAPISFYHFYRAGRKSDELVGINYIAEWIEWEVELSDEHTEYQWIKPEDFLQWNVDEFLIKDIKHLIQVKDLYFQNKEMFLKNFKESN